MSPILPLLEKTHTLRWLYVDFNSYFASVEQQLNPALRGRPVAVVPVETDATCAIAASYEAKAFGIKTGTPVYEAKARCPQLVCVLARHEHYLDFHERIKAEIDRHIPISMTCSIDEVACRLMDNETSVDYVTRLAARIKQGLAQHVGEYVRCSIGVAPNRYLAKVATDLHKPDGFTILRAEDLPQKLLALKLRDLPGIGAAMERRLRLSSLYTMEDLWALDARQLRAVWGSIEGEKMWYRLRGAEVEDEPTTRRTIGHSHVLTPELRPPAKAVYVARRLTLKAASRLRRLGYEAGSFSLAVRVENGPRLEATARLPHASDSITFARLMLKLWRTLAREAPRQARFKKISVVLHELRPQGSAQASLFEQQASAETRQRERFSQLSRALDKINHRFGRDSVLLGMLPSQGRGFSGTKIAFTRIPDAEEFLE
jgi:DNA polymerase-4